MGWTGSLRLGTVGVLCDAAHGCSAAAVARSLRRHLDFSTGKPTTSRLM